MLFTRKLTFAIIFSCVLFCCNARRTPTPPADLSRYDLLHPNIMNLPEGLAEISGITYYAKDSSLFAIQDEGGILYKIPINKRDSIQKWIYDKKHDFEDVTLVDSVFYVLISNGDIESVRFGAGDSIITHTAEFPKANKKHNEFESIYYDTDQHKLILFCKDCDDDGHKSVTAWGYDISTGTYTPGIFTIDVEPIAAALGEKKIKLKPSATAINPVTNELYILCSVNKLLVITDRQGKFKELFALDPAIYKQPEGLAFAPTGDMMISNESHETGSPD